MIYSLSTGTAYNPYILIFETKIVYIEVHDKVCDIYIHLQSIKAVVGRCEDVFIQSKLMGVPQCVHWPYDKVYF